MPNSSTTSAHRNHRIAVVFSNESLSVWRDCLFFLYPKGKRSVAIGLETYDGWALMTPDANHGFTASHDRRLSKQGGLWMRGDGSPTSCLDDVKIARILMGHRFWHVSIWRVWAYRFIASVILAVLSYLYVQIPEITACAALLPSLIRSPLTPRGLKLYAEGRGFTYPVLRQNLPGSDVELPPTAAALGRQ